jgi:hypothetical protein
MMYQLEILLKLKSTAYQQAAVMSSERPQLMKTTGLHARQRDDPKTNEELRVDTTAPI